MNNKTIFKPSFNRPIYKGKIIQYNPEQKKGIIRNDQGEELPFQTNTDYLQVGNLVTFNKYPCVKNPNRSYATNISKVYLSMDGYLVVDNLKSHVHSDLKEKLPSIVKRISCLYRDYIVEISLFQDIVGQSNCVPITWEDEIVYAKRLGRDKYSKFVKNRETIPTNCVSIFLKKKEDFYIIMSCYYGDFKVDPNLYSSIDEPQSFWNDHALVFGSEQIDPTTITTRCPWTGVSEFNLLGSIYRDKLCFQQHYQ